MRIGLELLLNITFKHKAMRLFKYGVLLFLCISLSGCEEEGTEEDEPERTNALITFHNNRGVSGCNPPYAVTFVVEYRDIQAFIDLSAPNTGFLNVLVEDGESIRIQVRQQSDDEVVADANVTVRTTSRPEGLEGEPRTVTFCRAFDLGFQNF